MKEIREKIHYITQAEFEEYELEGGFTAFCDHCHKLIHWCLNDMRLMELDFGGEIELECVYCEKKRKIIII